MKAIMDWFTPAKRKAIYGLVAGGAVALVAFGFVTSGPARPVHSAGFWHHRRTGYVLAFLNTSGK